MSSKDLFLDEIRSQYDRDFDLKNSLDTKSSYLIPISGIIISIIFGFGSSFLEKFDPNYALFSDFRILLIFSLVLNLSSIIFAILSFRITGYRYAFLYKKFYDDNGKVVDKKIEEYTEARQDDFKDMILKEYLECNYQNSKTNQNKANLIKISQFLLMSGLGLLSVLIILLFSHPPQFEQYLHFGSM